jgi:hypothetical protein
MRDAFESRVHAASAGVPATPPWAIRESSSDFDHAGRGAAFPESPAVS